MAEEKVVSMDDLMSLYNECVVELEKQKKVVNDERKKETIINNRLTDIKNKIQLKMKAIKTVIGEKND